MATRSAIGIKIGDKIKAIYCHWDGYVDNNGKILLEHYDQEKTKQLIDLGNLSSLGIEIGTKHDFDNPPKNECNFYGRDREESDTESMTFASAKDFVNEYLNWGCEYFYLLDKDVWTVSSERNIFVSVADALK